MMEKRQEIRDRKKSISEKCQGREREEKYSGREREEKVLGERERRKSVVCKPTENNEEKYDDSKDDEQT